MREDKIQQGGSLGIIVATLSAVTAICAAAPDAGAGAAAHLVFRALVHAAALAAARQRAAGCSCKPGAPRAGARDVQRARSATTAGLALLAAARSARALCA